MENKYIYKKRNLLFDRNMYLIRFLTFMFRLSEYGNQCFIFYLHKLSYWLTWLQLSILKMGRRRQVSAWFCLGRERVIE